MAYLQTAINEFQSIVNMVMSLMEPTVQERAFGVPGQPGNPERIQHLARRWISNYEAMLDWAARIRGTSHPAEFDRVFNLQATWADRPIHEFRLFVGDLVAQMDGIPAALSSGERVSITLTLAITLDEEITAALTSELARLRYSAFG